MSNAALFSTVAREYANFRAGYPAGLFEWLAQVAPAREAVWDAGCGSGQASVGLAAHFTTVHATDISPEQLAAAKPHERVRYSVAPERASGLGASSVDLITVAQALHWFDVEAFYDEARRVARPAAVLAVWTYPRPRFTDPAFDALLEDFYAHIVGPYWPPGRRHIEAYYESLPFPFKQLEAPPFGLTLDWTLAQVLGYVSSWSATVRYRQARNEDPVPWLAERLGKVWPSPDVRLSLSMPLVLKAARIGA